MGKGLALRRVFLPTYLNTEARYDQGACMPRLISVHLNGLRIKSNLGTPASPRLTSALYPWDFQESVPVCS